MYVRDLDGNEYMLQATSTNEGELNGSQSFSCAIPATKVNAPFIDDITEMWEVVDHDGVTHKIIYAKKKGEGVRLNIEIKAIPLFFDTFDNERIYEEHNEHMTAMSAFTKIFSDMPFDFVLVDQFVAVEWEGFGAGESRLETFKRALNRYKAEFRIFGDTIFIENQVGQDTQIMYRHKLNASNIVQEIDANEMWTYAKGYGDYADGEDESGNGEVYSRIKLAFCPSPLAKIPSIGKRHAPPIKDGRVKVKSEMDNSLKSLVDESLKISVSADIHDLRKHGYPIAQSQLGDRVFLIDERIGLDEEIRVAFKKITRDWRGNVIDLDISFGSSGLSKRHQANINTATKNINELFEGRKQLPLSALDKRVQDISAIINGNTDSVFKYMSNGVIGWNGDNPNYMTRYVGDAIGFSKDGGQTYGTAMSADLGIVADYITTGTLRSIIVEAVEIYGSRIEGTEIYGGLIEGSTIISKESDDEFIRLRGAELVSKGIHDRNWFDDSGLNQIRIMLQNGQIRARNDDKNWSFYMNDTGFSTFHDGSGESHDMDASGFLEVHSYRYSDGDYRGMTLGSGGRLALESTNEGGSRIYINPNGANVHIADANDNYHGISASKFSQSSSRKQKHDIKDLQDDALEIINSLEIKEYLRKTSGKTTDRDRWQVGIIVEDAPSQLLADGDSVDLYTYLNYSVRAQQQHYKKTMDIEARLSKLEEPA